MFKLRIAIVVISLIASIFIFIFIYLDKNQVRGYARQVYNFAKGDGSLNNINQKIITSSADRLVSGLQHSLGIKTIDLSHITTSWSGPRFSSPAYFFQKGNEIFIITNQGSIYKHSGEGKLIDKINTNLPEEIARQNYKSTDSKNGDDLSGRLGIKSSAYNPTDNFIYVAYHKAIRSNCYTMAIDRAAFNNEAIIFNKFYLGNFCRENFNAHDSGGRIGFLDEKVILTIGAFDINLTSNIDEINNLLNPSLEVGAVISIDKVGKSTILSKGHRNQQGLAIVGSKIFITEHGPMGGDQFINIKTGDNYGWPYYSYGFDYLYKDIYKRPKSPTFSEPIFYFLPSIATSQLIFYRGNEFPRFNDKFIISTLKSGSLFIMSSDDFTKRVQSVEQYDVGHRIRDLLISSEGKIWIITDDAKLLIVSRDLSDIPDKK